MSPNRLTTCALAGAFPVVEACYSWTWNDFHMTPHNHNRAEIMYLLRGKCVVHVHTEGAAQQFQLNVGKFIFIQAGVIHSLQVDGSCYMVNVEFSYAPNTSFLTLEALMNTSAALREWLGKKDLYQCGKDPAGVVYGVLSAVVDDYAHKDAVDYALRDLRLAQMLIQIATALLSTGTKSRCLVHVRRCIKLLSERMDEEVRINEIAAEIGVSASYLQRIFRQAYGMTIVEYLNRLRIDRAKLLLANTKDSVIDIAIASGFNSRQHFSRVFTVCEGCSPIQYRRKYLASDTKQVFLSS